MPTIDKPIWNTGLINNGKMEQVYELAVVRHGHWLRTEAYPHRIYCSECYTTFIRNDEFLHLEDIPHGYCPNCGAKMDREEENKYEEPEINPCRGCEDYDGKGGCKSQGGCGAKMDAPTQKSVDNALEALDEERREDDSRRATDAV